MRATLFLLFFFNVNMFLISHVNADLKGLRRLELVEQEDDIMPNKFSFDDYEEYSENPKKIINSALEKKALSLIDNFFNELEKIRNVKDFEEKFSLFSAVFKELGENEEEWLSDKTKIKLEELLDKIFFKFKEDILLKGLYLKNSGLIKISFEKEINCSQKITLRFLIASGFYSHGDVSNAYLVFLNRNGFEVFRHFLGNIKLQNLTGKVIIPEKHYNEFKFIKIVSDQDSGLPVP